MTATTATPMRLLVVDDEPLMQQVVVMLLRRMGHSGVVVREGAEALRALARWRFDGVLLDVSMAGMDGWETLQQLRLQERGGQLRTPVIMVSGHDLPEDRDRFLNGGADAYLTKPLDARTLQATLGQVCGR
jgi:CheY-like chemotaxis protein